MIGGNDAAVLLGLPAVAIALAGFAGIATSIGRRMADEASRVASRGR